MLYFVRVEVCLDRARNSDTTSKGIVHVLESYEMTWLQDM